MGARNDHKTIENTEIHPPKDFAIADSGDTLRKNLNDELTWDSNPWKIVVLNLVDINAAPPTEVDGDRYIVIEVASTVADAGWDGAAVNDIVEFSDTNNTWGKYTPTEGDATYVDTENDWYNYDGADWVLMITGGGGGGTISFPWKFSTNTADANPGSGNFRLNNGTQGSSTQIFVSDITDNGVDLSSILGSIKEGTDIYIQQNDDATKFHLATVNGAIVDATTYFKIPITINDSGADLQNNRTCTFVFLGTGADFSDGGEAGGANRTLGNTDAFAFALLTNNTQRISILSGGDVGMGTASPGSKLQIEKSSGSVGLTILVADGSSTAFINLGDNDDSNIGSLQYSHSANSMSLIVNAGTAILIDSSRNVGINQNNPTEKLHVVGNVKIEGQAWEDIQATLTPGGTTETIDFDDGNYAVLVMGSLAGNITLTLSNANAGAFYFIEIRQNSTPPAPPQDIIWPANVKWPGGTAPVISTGANAVDTVSLAYNGTNFLGTFAQNFS